MITMKHRITYITAPGSSLTNETLDLTENGLNVHDLQAAREDRYSFTFTDIPQDVGTYSTLLKQLRYLLGHNLLKLKAVGAECSQAMSGIQHTMGSWRLIR